MPLQSKLAIVTAFSVMFTKVMEIDVAQGRVLVQKEISGGDKSIGSIMRSTICPNLDGRALLQVWDAFQNVFQSFACVQGSMVKNLRKVVKICLVKPVFMPIQCINAQS